MIQIDVPTLNGTPAFPTGYVPKAQPEQRVGDVNSTARGSGARFNAGKAPLDLIPLTILAQSYATRYADSPVLYSAAAALRALGRWQETGHTPHLYDALEVLGLEHWATCAAAFDYGKKKYAEWNWAKGMQWSIPLGCAARHLLAVLDEVHEGDLDPESGVHHFGHVFCNVVMLLQFHSTYPEGDDRPRILANRSA